MLVHINPGIFNATVTIPASKSHTIRRLLFASLTHGVSRVEAPLDSLDALSCVAACRVLGAEIIEERDSNGGLIAWAVRGRKPGNAGRSVTGTSGNGTFATAESSGGAHIDVGNSGTTLFLALAAAALDSVPVTFTGDSQIARRGAAPLLDALAGLGITVTSSVSPDGKPGCTPITVCGPWKGGRASVSCPTSQYLSALLIAAPLSPAGTITEIDVPMLNEKPYIEMTLSYLKKLGIGIIAAADYSHFCIRGGGSYTPINGPVPGDFSSAAFPAAAAAISKGTVSLLGLDPADTQGDKIFFDYLGQMGCDVRWERESGGQGEWRVTVSRIGPLKGGVFDLNATPDMLPVMAVLGAFAEGETALVNAAHARIKETDRIAVMAAELRKLFAGNGSRGFGCTEKPDGLLIQGTGGSTAGTGNGQTGEKPPLKLDGHGDHRIVMALACAALGNTAPAEISGAEAADVTYPGFLRMLNGQLR